MMKRQPSPFSRGHGGFTLVEMMTVMAIAAVLVTIGMTAFGGLNASMQIGLGASMLEGELRLARQEAIARSRPVEVRFYEIPGPDGASRYRAVASYLVTDEGPRPLRKPQMLPEQVTISGAPNLSTLVNQAPVSGEAELAAYGPRSYRSFHFRPGGGTDLSTSGTPSSSDAWFVTLVGAGGSISEDVPAYFTTLQIDPLNGSVINYRAGQ
jgi:uncharacterized protein (TIGR02596 family)